MAEGDGVARGVVVGIDGSTGSRGAVEFAADEAVARRVPLHLLCVTLPALMLSPPLLAPFPTSAPDPGLDPVPGFLEELAEQVRRTRPGLETVPEVVPGGPSAVLVERSRTADLVVVGARGHGGFLELLAGSVATQVATHAHCPAVVVRGTARHEGPVVVGVDDAPETDVAVDLAFYEAVLHGRRLRAVHVGHGDPDAPLARWRSRYPDVAVETVSSRDKDVAAALVAASEDARMVVVGSRGRGGLRSLLLGSVGYALAHHAHCPVVIAHPTAP
ncbi:universal stress protein [Longispora urticae]